MFFLHKGTLRCQLDLDRIKELKWLEVLEGGSYKRLAQCPFNIELDSTKHASFWQYVQFSQEYNFDPIEEVRKGPWRFAFTVAGTDLPCGVYINREWDLSCLVDRVRSSDKSGAVDTEVEVVCDHLDYLHTFVLYLRLGKLSPHEDFTWPRNK